MRLIVGLGNPGKQYEKTRHNVGFMIVDALREHLEPQEAGTWSLSKKFNAEIAEVSLNGDKVILAKPMTYMNDSGQSVGLIMKFYKIPLSNLIVVHDEKDLLLGTVKIHTDRGHAGHNGIKSIIKYTGSKDFTRYRVGVASTNERKMSDTSRFVLGKFGLTEKKLLRHTISDIVRGLDAEIQTD